MAFYRSLSSTGFAIISCLIVVYKHAINSRKLAIMLGNPTLFSSRNFPARFIVSQLYLKFDFFFFYLPQTYDDSMRLSKVIDQGFWALRV